MTCFAGAGFVGSVKEKPLLVALSVRDDEAQVILDRHGEHPVTAKVTTSQGVREQFFIGLNSGTRAIGSDGEAQRYIAQRWGTA